jgi:hypothetical protein
MQHPKQARPKRQTASETPKKAPSSGASAGSASGRQEKNDADDLLIVPDKFMPEWNYTIFPRTKK